MQPLEIDNLCSPIIERNLMFNNNTKKASGLGFIGEFHQTFKEELYKISCRK